MQPSLVRTTGPQAGARYPLRAAVVRLGRSPKNDVVLQGPDAEVVSAQHAEIRREGGDYKLLDLDSTNGTFLDGERVYVATLKPPGTIRLGPPGAPEFAFVLEPDTPAPELSTTLAVPVLPAEAPTAEHDQLLQDAVARARIVRRTGAANQTIEIMREVLDSVLERSGRKFRRTVALMMLLLVAVTAFGFWRIRQLKAAKGAIDQQIRTLEARLNQPVNLSEADRLIAVLDQYQTEGAALQRSLFYRFGIWERDDFVQRELKILLAEFGAEVYSVPPEFLAEVHKHLKRFQGPDRPNMTRVLGAARPVLERMRRIFEENNLPPDLAYMALVESAALDGSDRSEAGAAGLWQFTAPTARQFGLKVGNGIDERLDYRKATQAACRYMRELILDFGAGTSVMLALAAYNVGPARVKSAIHQVEEPIKQRNFWYLYRTRALPLETREYVPKVFAAMIIGRNPEKFGF